MQVFAVRVLAGTDFSAIKDAADVFQVANPAQRVIQRRMVGREPILQSVRTIVAKLVTERHSSVLMIESTAGMGKTCLLNHLIRDEEFEGRRGRLHIFQASGNPAFKSIPLYPWRSIFKVGAPAIARLPPSPTKENTKKRYAALLKRKFTFSSADMTGNF